MLHPLIQIDSIEELQFLLPSLKHLQIDNIESEKLNLQFNFQLGILEENKVLVLSKFVYRYPSELQDQNFPVMDYEVKFQLTVKDIKEEYEKPDIREVIDITIMQLLYSTVRGMLAIRTSGTPMSRFPLPVIDPRKLKDQMKHQKVKAD